MRLKDLKNKEKIKKYKRNLILINNIKRKKIRNRRKR